MKYQKIEKYMKENNLSLREFARRCDIPSSTICRMLNGKVDVQKSNIDKILLATKMNYEECFAEKEREEKHERRT